MATDMPAAAGDRMPYLRYLDMINEVSRPLPPMPVADLGPPVMTALAVPLSQARVMVLNSAGVHFRGEEPFRPTNDLSFRRIPRGPTRGGSGHLTRRLCAAPGCATSTWYSRTSGWPSSRRTASSAA